MEIKDETRNLKIFCKWKFISAVKCYETVYKFKKSIFKNQILKTLYLIGWGYLWKNIYETKVLPVQLLLVLGQRNGFQSGVAMVHLKFLNSWRSRMSKTVHFDLDDSLSIFYALKNFSFFPFVSLFSFCYTKKASWLVITGAFQSDTKTTPNPGDLWILNILNKIDTKWNKFKIGTSLLFKMIIRTFIQNCFNGNSTIACYSLRSF